MTTKTENELRELLKTEITKNGLRAFAKKVGVSPTFIGFVRDGRNTITQDIARQLGFQKVEKEVFFIELS